MFSFFGHSLQSEAFFGDTIRNTVRLFTLRPLRIVTHYLRIAPDPSTPIESNLCRELLFFDVDAGWLPR